MGIFKQIFKPNDNPQFQNEMSTFGLHWKLILADGVSMLVLSLIALYLPLISATRLANGLASVLLINGVIYLTQALEFRQVRGAITRLLQASLSFIIGSVLYQYSDSGMLGITLGLTFYFLIGAILSWVFYADVRPHGGWNWGVLSSITSFALGLYMAVIFPFAPLWLPGAMLGLELFVSGCGLIGFALSVQKYHPNFQRTHTNELHRDQNLFNSKKPSFRI